MLSHWQFVHLQPKLWAKERPGLKLAVWLLTTKSRESSSSRCPIWECNMALERSRRGLQLWFRPRRDFEVIIVKNLNNHYVKSGSLKRDAPFKSLTNLHSIVHITFLHKWMQKECIKWMQKECIKWMQKECIKWCNQFQTFCTKKWCFPLYSICKYCS